MTTPPTACQTSAPSPSRCATSTGKSTNDKPPLSDERHLQRHRGTGPTVPPGQLHDQRHLRRSPQPGLLHCRRLPRRRSSRSSSTAAADEIQRGDGVEATVEVAYFFGGPLADTEVSWNILAESCRFKPTWGGPYSFSDTDDPYRCFDCWWWWHEPPARESILSGTGTTDANGTLTITDRRAMNWPMCWQQQAPSAARSPSKPPAPAPTTNPSPAAPPSSCIPGPTTSASTRSSTWAKRERKQHRPCRRGLGKRRACPAKPSKSNSTAASGSTPSSRTNPAADGGRGRPRRRWSMKPPSPPTISAKPSPPSSRPRADPTTSSQSRLPPRGRLRGHPLLDLHLGRGQRPHCLAARKPRPHHAHQRQNHLPGRRNRRNPHPLALRGAADGAGHGRARGHPPSRSHPPGGQQHHLPPAHQARRHPEHLRLRRADARPRSMPDRRSYKMGLLPLDVRPAPVA